MAKFNIELSLEKFSLKISGDREDIPIIASNVGQQVAGMLQPAANIVDGDIVTVDERVQSIPPVNAAISNTRKNRRRRVGIPKVANADGGNSEFVFWEHSPTKWGNAQQGWNTTKKAIWLLYVVSHETEHKDMSASMIARTFNHHFRSAGAVHPPNVSRDLSKLKSKPGAPVGEDTAKSPSHWYLTESGKKMAVGLVEEALGKTTS